MKMKKIARLTKLCVFAATFALGGFYGINAYAAGTVSSNSYQTASSPSEIVTGTTSNSAMSLVADYVRLIAANITNTKNGEETTTRTLIGAAEEV